MTRIPARLVMTPGLMVASAAPEVVQLQGMVHGFTTAIWWAVGILVLAATIAFTLVNAGKPCRPAETTGDDGQADDQLEPVVT